MRPACFKQILCHAEIHFLFHSGQRFRFLPDTEAAVPVGTEEVLSALMDRFHASRALSDLLADKRKAALFFFGNRTVIFYETANHAFDIIQEDSRITFASFHLQQCILPVRSQLR